MKTWSWLVVAVVGLGAMLAAYTSRDRTGSDAPWASGLMVIGPELPAELAQTGQATRVRVRLLATIERTEAILKVMNRMASEKAARLEARLRPKLILMPLEGSGIDASALQSGRLPEPGRGQVIAGSSATHKDRLTAGDRALEVVGVLEPEVGLFRDDYLIPPADAASALFPDGDPSVRTATLVRLSPEQFRDRGVIKGLDKSLPSATYTLLIDSERLEPTAYYLYLGGLAAFLLGGSGALIGLFRGLAAWARRPSVFAGDDRLDPLAEPVPGTVRPSWWAAPLVEMEQRPRLVWGVHLVYFGLVIATSLWVYYLPDVQAILLSSVRDALTASSGPLASAAQAYESGNIARAAATTFVINFFLGSLLMLTLPSIIVPGSGTLVAALRAVMWGFILAPTMAMLAYGMLPHAGTMLLEGEGYILATLFGLLIPIHIFQSSLGGTPLSRFGLVLRLNVPANLWVAVVLAVAACYEATEVIWMNR